jgi:cyanate permease
LTAPAITVSLAKATGSYQSGLLLAAVFVALAALLLYWLKRTDQTLAQLQ